MQERIIKYILPVLAIIIVVAFVLALSNDGNDTADVVGDAAGDAVGDAVATVNGVPISQQEFDREYRMILNYYETIARKLTDKEKKGLQEEVLAKQVDKVVILQEAEKRNISVTDEDVEKYISNKFKGDQMLQDEYLQERSLTLQDYKDMVRYQLIREKLYDIVTKDYVYEEKPIRFTKYLNELKKKAKIEVHNPPTLK